MLGVLKRFEIPPDQYADDVRNIMEACITRHGTREWKLVVLTNEIHGHLGIYATIGAKMGLHAREMFEKEGISAPVSIVSFAGCVPPLGCLNDGLQISTGATLGHGQIKMADEPEKRVEAIFLSGDKTIHLRLKPEFEAQIRQDILHGVHQYGNGPDYWQYVRDLAIKYWLEWDRQALFKSEPAK